MNTDKASRRESGADDPGAVHRAQVGTGSRARGPRREDTEPWYRQFWPWFLIALPGSVVVAGISMVVVANRHADDLVVDSYYKDGLAINRQLEKQARASEIGIDADLLLVDERVQVRLAGEAADTVAPLSLSLRLSHPLEADRDFSVRLERVAPALYVGALPKPAAVNWHWTLEPESELWRLDGSLGAEDFLGADSNSP
jgi:hypothetical protein